MCTLPTEIWLKIGLYADEYTFNALVRAVPSLGRWTMAGHSGNIVDRRLDLMVELGYQVEFLPVKSTMLQWTEWRLNGIMHRNDEPARVYNDGTTSWMKQGVFYRRDGPALVDSAGSYSWYPRRGDGYPSFMYEHGYILWAGPLNVLHRYNGPARIYEEGRIEWYKGGVLHRIGGPAVIHLSGDVEYWIDGHRCVD